MKVVLFQSYGINQGNTKIAEYLNSKPFPENRIGDIVDFIESTSQELPPDTFVNELSSLDKDEIFRLQDNIYLYFDFDSRVHGLTIVDVDINKPWTIDDYDGSERIKYFEPIKLCNKEMNYYTELVE